MATLHSTKSTQTLERLLNLFPEDMHAQIRMLLSLSLVGNVSQRLVASSDRTSRFAAVEVLLPTPRVRDLTKQGDLAGVKAGRLSKEDATAYADSPSDFKLRFRLEGGPAAQAAARPQFTLK